MSKPSKINFKIFLNEIRKKAQTEREKGELFERAIRDFLKASPEHSFENVWLWPDWPDLGKNSFSKKDLGIDLVAKEKETGIFWAIQCKCFDENYQVNKQDIDSFFTLSGKNPFKVRLIVTTTANWGLNALDALKNQTKECKTLDLHDLKQADFEWSFQKVKRKQIRKYLRDHQREAVQKSVGHFQTESRGKLIMACGTGKTFTSLRILEKITPENANILFLAPSISLISQTLREYAWQRKKPQRYLAVCSDTKAGKDTDGYDVNDLQISPTTNSKKIAERLKKKSKERTIVFSTYQSLREIKEAQKRGAPQFDLVICDEAHRTTGVEAGSLENGKSTGNYFTSINDENYVKAEKRLYMTATSKIYSEKIKSKARKHEMEIHSMDEESVFGKEIYRLDFSKAIERKLLSDYKVIILSIDEQYMSDNIQEVLKDTQLKLGDASRLVGCYKALRDQGDEKQEENLRRAVGFLNTIQASKDVRQEFQKVVKVLDDHKNDGFTCETEHIDGTDSSIIRNKKLDWLKEDAGQTDREEKICRILLNSKCLTEGIDVPSLDAVMFLHPRKSQVDVVQAVGRIMRRQEGKNYGYVILPVVIPTGKSPEKALNDNETYKVVWQVLNALRSHDSQFKALVNNLELNENKADKIKVVGIGFGSEREKKEFEEKTNPHIQLNLQYSIEKIEEKIYAKIVEKCGDRVYEEKWAKEIEKACKTISTRIESLLKTKPAINKEFQIYYKGLKDCINEDIREAQAVSMLSEHLITKPAFDRIFENYKFSENNPVSKTMKKVLDKLDDYGFRNELKDLEKFYQGISRRLEGIDNSKRRQTVIKELYENFIKTAFPKTAEKLGVAYTPVEIVDFILRSVDEILKEEFNKGLTDEGVHIIDPFVGTGTFLNRLISYGQSENVSIDHHSHSFSHSHINRHSRENGNPDKISTNPLIKKKDLPRKFQKELHANDILLLPYYVASINIEEAYHSRMGGKYTQFPKITLSDIFNRDEKDKQLSLSPYFQENSRRIKQQQEADLQVIIGNPPYSSGQKSENDANKNTVYPKLHKRIAESYVKESEASNKNALYDSYIKAIRWATDEIKDKGGIIGFVHSASFVSGRSTAGLRKSLVKEFDSIYCFNLRGNARTKGKQRQKEKDNVFGQNTRTPVAITFLVKNPEKRKERATIKYHDIGDYLSREEKLERVKDFHCVKGMKKREKWQTITPDKYGDWINQRDESFYQFMPIGDKRSGNQNSIFSLYSQGIKTHRDAWVYNFNKNQVRKNMKNMIQFYNEELDRFKHHSYINRPSVKALAARPVLVKVGSGAGNLDKTSNFKKEQYNNKNIDQFISLDEKKIKWSRDLKNHLLKSKKESFKEKNIQQSSYRPFTKSHLYFSKVFNSEIYQVPKLFPIETIKNKIICVSGVGAKTFSVLMTDCVPDVGFMPSGQCFPLYKLDEPQESNQKSLIEESGPSYSITDKALNQFRNHYENLAKSGEVSQSQFQSQKIKSSKGDKRTLLNLAKRENQDSFIKTSEEETALSHKQFQNLKNRKEEGLKQGHGINPASMSSAVSSGFQVAKQHFSHTENQTDQSSKASDFTSLNDKQKQRLKKTLAPITKEDIFYYIYGLLHSEDYRERYKSNLDKELPRIPLVPEFWEFSNIGRKLSDLHLNYENQPPLKEPKILKGGKEINISSLQGYVKLIGEKETKEINPSGMQNFPYKAENKNFAKSDKDKKSKKILRDNNKNPFQKGQAKSGHFTLPEGLTPEDLKVQKMRIDKNDKSKIQFNEHITIANIPEKAWEYKINGYSAPKWIIERYQYKQDKKTDIINDPNTYSEDPAYILKLLLSVITVSVKTRELVQNLPSIDFDSLISSTDKTR